MKRDTIKTILGLAVIGLIVFATYLYGNAQRQAQIKNDQKTTNEELAKASPSPSVAAASVAPTPSAASNTKPVQSPSSNSIQGGGTPTPATGGSGKVASATTTPSVVPATGGATAPLPDTGAPELGLLGIGAIIAAIVWLKVSQRSLLEASRTRR